MDIRAVAALITKHNNKIERTQAIINKIQEDLGKCQYELTLALGALWAIDPNEDSVSIQKCVLLIQSNQRVLELIDAHADTYLTHADLSTDEATRYIRRLSA